MAEPEISIIVPTYNERWNISILSWLLDKHVASERAVELIVVDDGSPDGTQAQVKSLAETFPKLNVKLSAREEKLGIGSAYKKGLELCESEKIVIMDSDLSHHPKHISLFLEKMSQHGADIVTGTRYIPGGGVYGWDVRRKATSRGANMIGSFLLGKCCSDLTGSFRLYRKQALEKVMSQVTCQGYGFQVEAIARAQKMKCAIAEVPITFVDRVEGRSKLGACEPFRFLFTVVFLSLTL